MQNITLFKTALSFLLYLGIVLGMCAAVPAQGAFLYKSYIVRQDSGHDILCDPYVVQKNDYVLKLFRQKGEISHTDFPEFLTLFQKINPHIRDINQIRPGQQIFIPLKKLQPGVLPGQSSGIVTIPFVTISHQEERSPPEMTPYQVQTGDCVSILISKRFGAYGSKSYQEGLRLFQSANPDIANIHRIYQGQMLFIPNPAIKQVRVDPSASLKPETGFSHLGETPFSNETTIDDPGKASNSMLPASTPDSPLSEIADVLNATLKERGRYFFPNSGSEDVAIDLSVFPVMEFNEQTFIFETDGRHIDESDRQVIESYWRNVRILSMSRDPSMEQLLEAVLDTTESDIPKIEKITFQDGHVNGLICAQWIISPISKKTSTENRTCITTIEDSTQKTPDTITKYLAQHGFILKEPIRNKLFSVQAPVPSRSDIDPKDVFWISTSTPQAFVTDFAKAIGCRYMPNTAITFPYAGIQVRAFSNLLISDNGKELLVDYGDLYGDAVESIRRTGFNILQLRQAMTLDEIIPQLVRALGISCQSNPVFKAADRPGPYNTMLTIPGYLIQNPHGQKVLVAVSSLPDQLIQFFNEQKIALAGIHLMK